MTKKDDRTKAIPYGVSDYPLIRTENYYYVDKTSFIKSLEDAGRYLFLIRPRRFGKSLFVSLLETYYDIANKEHFNELFKDTWIHENPTEERNKYLVLSFNFATVNPDPAKLEDSFINHIRTIAISFLEKYSEHFTGDKEYYEKAIEKSLSASDILATLSELCKVSRLTLYVIIDEYDNFANTILSTVGTGAYHDLTHGTGSYRAFFNVLKGGTTGSGAPFSRLFLTGVSPITLDDVTSGYNIGENVSLDAAFNSMLGFTRSDVREMLDYYKTAGMIKHDTSQLLDITGQRYGNYLFSKYADINERMHNADMILYFLKEYFKIQSIPEKLLDRNVRTDYGKLRHLIIVDKKDNIQTNGNFERLKEIVEKGEISSTINEAFPLEKLTHRENFISLLFYFGLLTIKSVETGSMQLGIPNETIRRLFYDYIKEGYEETGVFSIDLYNFGQVMTAMAMKGEWKPLFDYIAGRMRESMSLRDLITGEKSIQAFLNVYLGLSQLYIVHPEKKMNKGYADIFLEPFLAGYEGIKYSYLLEIKYTKAGARAGDDIVQKLKTEAEAQLRKYSLDEKMARSIGKTTLVKLVLVFSGHELVHLGSVD